MNDNLMFGKTPYIPKKLEILDLKVQYKGGDSYDAIVSCKVIQGLVNRQSGNKLYFYNDCTDMTHNIGGKTWNVQKKWLENLPELNTLSINKIKRQKEANGGLHALLRKYRDVIEGIVIWDDNSHNKVNMAACAAAVTIASQKNGIPVSPSIYEQIKEWGYDFNILDDLRSYGFTSDHDLLKWSVDNYLSGSNKDLNCIFSLGMDGWAPNHIWADNWLSNNIFHEGPIDYAVSLNGFCFNINMSDGNDEEALFYLLQNFPEGKTAILGWVPSHPFLYGLSETPACLNRTSYFVIGVNGVSNLSVLSSFDNYIHHERAVITSEKNAETFIAFLSTDGDALHCVYRGMFAAFLKQQPSKQNIPIVWTIHPAFAIIAPPIMRFFQNNIPTGSDFVAAWADKIQTVYDTKLDVLMPSIKKYADIAGIKSIWTINAYENTQMSDICKWYSVIEGYSDSRKKAAFSTRDGVTPCFGTWNFSFEQADEIAKCIIEICKNANNKKPFFMYIVLGACFDDAVTFYDKAEEIAKILDEYEGMSFSFLNSEQMAQSFHEKYKHARGTENE